MCMYIENTRGKEYPFRVATKNIVVYKSLNKSFSAYMNYLYSPLKVNFIPKNSISNNILYVKDGSYLTGFSEVNVGFHSRIHKESLHYNNSIFIIPKGSKYLVGREYYNDHKENNYVSNHIVYVGKRDSPITYLKLLLIKLGVIRFKLKE